MTQQQKPHILIVDGMALLFRSFFATAHSGQYFRDAEGVPTNGVQGFARHTISAISLFQPTHLAVCWDMGASTFRNDLFQDYKAHRPPPPPELVPQFDKARNLSETLGWKSYGIANWEADDLIGSLVETWSGEAGITVVTGDKDLLQVLRPNVEIAFTQKGFTQYDVFTEARFMEEYLVNPKQLIDIKAFTGDPSDGYPGVKGIGQKTALRLIQDFGSVEEVVRNVHTLTPALRKKIMDNLEILYLSKKLAEIDCSLEVNDPIEQMKIPVYTDDIKQKVEEQHYFALAKQIAAFSWKGY